MRFASFIMLAGALVCSGAGAWNVDPNLVSSIDLSPTWDSCSIASNTTTGKLAVVYWSQNANAHRLVYSEKDPAMGTWNREVLVTLQGSDTAGYDRGSVGIDFTPDDRPIILYSYTRTTLSGGNPTGKECVCNICEKTSSGIANERTLLSRTLSATENAGAPGNALFVGDANNMIAVSVVMSSSTPEQSHQVLVAELLDGPQTGFARKELLHEVDQTLNWNAPGAICGGGLTWDSVYKSRMMLGLVNAAQQGDINYYGYVSETQTSSNGFNPLELFCPPSSTSSFQLIGIVSSAFGGDMFLASDSTGCLNIVYGEAGSELLRYASEATPLSTLWLESSINTETGQPASTSWMAADHQYQTLGMACKPTTRIMMAERTISDNSVAVRVAQKGAGNYQWTWGPRLPVSGQMYLIVAAKNCDAVAYCTSSGQIQVALP